MADSKLPLGEIYPRDRLRLDFIPYTAAPIDLAELSFRVLVPRVWRQDASGGEAINSQRLVPLALFAATDFTAYLQIQGVRLEREISAEHWLRHFLISAGYTAEEIVGRSDQSADSLCDFAIAGKPFRARAAVRLHGDVAFLVFTLCLVEHYAALAEAFGVIVASFQPTAAPRRPTIEDHSTGSVDVPPGTPATFSYPASWRFRAVPPVPGKAGADLVAVVDDIPISLIRVKMVGPGPMTRAELQIEDTLDEFADAGFTAQQLFTETSVAVGDSRFTGGILRVYTGVTAAGLPQELWIIAVDGTVDHVTISLLVPDRRHNFLIWAWARRALDIVTTS